VISSGIIYLLTIAAIAGVFGIAERYERTSRYFIYLPAIVLVYLFAMVAAQGGVWQKSEEIENVYTTARNNILPAMLFLMLLQLDLSRFVGLGRSMLIAYVAATLSIAVAFAAVFAIFGFGETEAGLFGALCGSWMGGTANMLAVGGALGVDEVQMGYALVVDAVCYTFWVVFLLSIVRFAPRFSSWSGAAVSSSEVAGEIGCSCTIGPKRYWLLLGSAFFVALLSQTIANHLGGLGTTAWTVLIATVLGIVGSFMPLSRINGSAELASTMLLLLVALIGSRADFSDFGSVPLYVAAGFSILSIHALLLVAAAKLFRLDLFSIAVASLANIGGVASAPVLAAAYDRALVGIAVLMAVVGYLVGTFGGLGVGYLLRWLCE